MIKIENLVKKYGNVKALDNISLEISEKKVFGLIGTNAAGKSTLLRLISGVMKEDAGSIRVDGLPVYENPAGKMNICFISDYPFFFPNTNAGEMKKYYLSVYSNFDGARFDKLLKDFGLDPKRRVSEYSKGMKKQLAILLGLCTNTKYLLLDEVFDGLDPVVRQGVKSLFAEDMDTRGLTPIIASHNLRELEDICDHVGFLHSGGLLLSEELADMKIGIQKIQCVFEDETEGEKLIEGLEVIDHNKRGRLHTLVVRGEAEMVKEYFKNAPMVFFEVLPLTLEEIFISETEAAGYDIRKLILG